MKYKSITISNHDVFFSIWNDIEQYDEKRGEFSSFIFMKTKYKALDYKRKLDKLQLKFCKKVYQTQLLLKKLY